MEAKFTSKVGFVHLEIATTRQKFLVRGGIPLDPVCSRCGMAEESLEHFMFSVCLFQAYLEGV